MRQSLTSQPVPGGETVEQASRILRPIERVAQRIGLSLPDAAGDLVEAVNDVRADIASLLGEQRGMADELLRAYEQIGVVFEITRALLEISKESEVLPTFIQCLSESYAATECMILGARAGGDGTSDVPEDAVPEWIACAIRECREQHKVRVVDSGSVVGVGRDGAKLVADEALIAPVYAGDEFVAAVTMRRRGGTDAAVRRFDSNDMQLLESLSGFCGDVVRSIRLVGDLRNMSMETVRTLVNAVDQKDPYTSGHSGRVGYYAMLLGREVGYDEQQLRTLEWSALLHDVGKIGIRDAVLKKPGRLTKEEFDHIKEHPLRGFEVVRENPHMKDALDGVLYHHERYDGNGYPRGLKGEDIPFQARIIQIADVFDALTSTRSYRSAFHWREALDVLRRDAGTAFDPALAVAFVSLVLVLYERNPGAFEEIGRPNVELKLAGEPATDARSEEHP